MSNYLDELKEKTRKIAEKYGEGRTPGEGPNALWAFFDEDLANVLVMHYFGQLYAREKIPHTTRPLAAVAALTVLERTDELRSHIWAGLNVGCISEEIAEVIFQVGPYGGIPVVNTALKVFRDVLKEREEVFGEG